MIKFFPAFSLVGLVLFALTTAQAAFVVQFKTTKGVEVKASGNLVDKSGHFVTVILRDWDVKTLTVADHKVKDVNYDPITGLVSGTLVDPKGDAVVTSLGQGRSLKPGQVLDASKQAAVLAGWERMFNGNIPPLALMKIRYEGGIPLPGTALTDEKGGIVGFVHHQVWDQNSQSYAIPAEAAEKLISGKKKNGKLQRCWVGFLMEPAASCPELTSLRPDSPATKAGLKKGDMILAIGDEVITSYMEAVDAFYYLEPDKPVEFRVLRGTQVISLEVVPVVHALQPK